MCAQQRSNSAAITLVALVTAVAVPSESLADWPTYRGDIRRTGSTAESISTPLKRRWTFESPSEPQTAWAADEEGRVVEGLLLGDRTKYDDALHPVVAADRVYFGSSVDHQLYCLDLSSGRTVWTFCTGGPIRLAPTVSDGRVYFGSDDGYAYCLNAPDGRLVWRYRGGPADEWILARGVMTSRWPVRTGVLVDDGVAYFGAGIFPHDDVFIYAVDAATGDVIWKQDHISARNIGRDNLSPQGQLLANDEFLFVPSGRGVPAALDRRTGNVVHQRFQGRTKVGGTIGSTQALLADGQIYTIGPNNFLAMDQKTGLPGFGWFKGREIVVRDDAAFVADGNSLARLDREVYAVNSRKRYKLEGQVYDLSFALARVSREDENAAELREQLDTATTELKRIADVGIVWQQPTENDASLLNAGDLVFAGGEGQVAAFGAEDGALVWSGDVPGKARGLVAASGCLLVSTDNGHICCFARSETTDAERLVSEPPSSNPYPRDHLSDLYSRAAEDIVRHTGIDRGYCLVVGVGEGRLAYELAQRTDLKIYCVDPDAERVNRARQALLSSGLYGHRIVVHHADAADIPYSNYFANLIVSDTVVATGRLSFDPAKVVRHLKPVGGVFCLGRPTGEPVGTAQLVSELEQSGLDAQSETTQVENWALLERGPLPGAGGWTHQYADPGNTAVSDERLVKGGLRVLWYGDPGPGEIVNRHDAPMGPLSVNGRLFVQGETAIKAYDAYNGLHLWTHENPKAIRTGVFTNHTPGNLAATDDRVFFFSADECHELDAATGEVVRVHRLPPGADDGRNQWGYLAVQDGILFGTATIREEVRRKEHRRGRITTEMTDSLFAIDLATGAHLWNHRGKSISHQTIAVGPEKVYFIDSSITSDQRARILRQDKSQLVKLTGKEREVAEERLKSADVRMAVALDARTGDELWAEPVDVTDCSEIGIGGGKLTLMYADGVLVLCGANANGHYWNQFVAGEFARRRLVALSAEDGYKLWAKDANYRHRPIIIRDKILAEPWMFDLRTGEQVTRLHPFTNVDVPWSIMRAGHHCGMLTGCDAGMLLFRTDYTGFFDLDSDAGVQHFPGHRLGCWINAVFANGLALIPEASAGCTCAFSIASTVVLEPHEPRRPWSVYSAVGSQTPVQHMAVNLGAPGDRKDARGTVWFAYPRLTQWHKETTLDVKLDLQHQFSAGGGFGDASEASTEHVSAPAPWLYASWAGNLTGLTLPLLGEDDQPATYTLRLYVADTRAGSAGADFDVRAQGELAMTDVRAEPIGKLFRPKVYEITDIAVKRDLVLEFVPKSGTPILCAIEAIRTQ